MAKETNEQPSSLVERLDPLIGEWNVKISAMSFRANPSETVIGQVKFDWLANQAFVMKKSEFSDDDFPSGTELIGFDDTIETYNVLYSDSRGVLRLYEMTLHEGVWKVWRTAPGFYQRFTGLFSHSNEVIKAQWESSPDGVHWEHDFDLLYTKVMQDG